MSVDIVIESVGKHVYLQVEQDGKPVYRKPLALCIREFLEPTYVKDDEYHSETAFLKLEISKILKLELDIA